MSLLITNTSFLDRETYPNAAPDALTMNGDHLEVINIIISNGQQGIAASQTGVNHLVYGCLIFHNGLVPGFGHGIYNQNLDIAGKRYIQNIFIDNFGANFAPHGSAGLVDYITLRDNILANAGSPASEARHNIFWDNASDITSPVIYGNAIYQGQASAIHSRLGDPDNATNNVSVYDNYIVGDPGALVIYGSSVSIDRLDGNEFYGGVEGWNTLTYADNVYETAIPTSGKKIMLWENAYASNMANLAIFNFDQDDTVDVDVSALGWTGIVNAHNLQDYFADVQALEIVNGILTVNVQAANRSVATPSGWTPPATTFPNFGAFRLVLQ